MVNPDDISELADWERKKEKKRGENKPVQKQSQDWQPKSCDSWYVFRRIYPIYPNFFWWFFGVLTLGIVFISIYFSTAGNRPADQWSLYIGLGFIGLFMLRLLIHHAMKIIAFNRYKGWRQKLGFQLNGWDVLGRKKDFPKTHHWDKQVEYTVQVESFASQAVRKTIHDALYLFNRKANGCFYEKYFAQSGYSGEIRVKWTFVNELSVAGSADDTVVGYMYLNIVEYLKPIHEKHKVIRSVDIKFSGHVYEVEPPSTD